MCDADDVRYVEYAVAKSLEYRSHVLVAANESCSMLRCSRAWMCASGRIKGHRRAAAAKAARIKRRWEYVSKDARALAAKEGMMDW